MSVMVTNYMSVYPYAVDKCTSMQRNVMQREISRCGVPSYLGNCIVKCHSKKRGILLPQYNIVHEVEHGLCDWTCSLTL
jgi:hypothetical protein